MVKINIINHPLKCCEYFVFPYVGDDYFIVKTAMPLLFSAKKWLHVRKDARKTAYNFVPTKRFLSTERSPKGLEMAK